jgi:hypothetical protein
MSLGLRLSDQHHAASGLFNIGIASGDKRRQMLCLRTERDLILVAGNNEIPLPELVGFHDGRYSIDVAMIRYLVDSETTANPRHTPSNARREARKLETQARHGRWRTAYREQKKKHPKKSDAWHAQRIAKGEFGDGRNAETIRKNMKK